MNTERRTAALVGVLFLLGYVGVFLGGALYGPALNHPDFPFNMYANRNQVVIGMLIELVNDIAVVGIAVFLYPILRRFSPAGALAYLSMRMLEAVMLIVSKVGLLSLIGMSESVAAADAPTLQALGTFAVETRAWASTMQVIFFLLGALTLYVVLYRSRLVPRWISVWGLFAVVCLAVANLLNIPDPTEGFTLPVLLFAPIFLSEFILAGWLIVKGFRPDAAPADAPLMKRAPA